MQMTSFLHSCTAHGVSALRRFDKSPLAQLPFRFFATDRRRDGHDAPGRSRKNSVKERERGNSRASPIRKEQTESNISGMKNILETIDQGLEIPLKGSSKGKLNRALQKPQAVPLSQADQGALETLAEEIGDTLNEALDSVSFMHTFPGIIKTSSVIEFDYVRLNKDASHVTVYWRSDMVEALVKEVIIKEQEEKQTVLLAGDGSAGVGKDGRKVYDAAAVLDRAEKHVKKCLKAREGRFRSYLSRHVEFRRVPRILFEISDGVGLKNDIIQRTEGGVGVKPEYERKSESFLHEEFLQHLASERKRSDEY